MNLLENNNLTPFVEEDGFNFGKFISLALSHWKLFVICVVLCIAGASARLYFSVPQYNI